MNKVSRTLEIDAETDARLREMAAERGQEVAAVLAEAVALLDSVVDLAGPDIGEDRRRYDEFQRTRLAVPSDDVKAWVASWGVRRRIASSATAQGRMILLSPDAALDVERLRTFLDQTNPDPRGARSR